MTSDVLRIIADIEEMPTSLISSPHNTGATRELFSTLRRLARDPQFLSLVDKSALDRLVAIFVSIDPADVKSQLDCVATLANVLCVNVGLREDEATATSLQAAMPVLFAMLDLVGEREINSESQYQEFLPIFRLYFFLTHIPALLPQLRESVLKISAKLLNFVTMSTQDSQALDTVIIEILKILYSTFHQVDDTSGIDSSFVLSCNKFNILYAKNPKASSLYDEILQHFANVLMVISTDVSRNYMLNKLLFASNQVCLVNKNLERKVYTATGPSPVPALLTLDVLMTIDSGESGIEQLISDNLDLKLLGALVSSGTIKDPHLPIVVQNIEKETGKFRLQENSLSMELEQAAQYRAKAEAEAPAPRLEDLTEEEQDEEIAKMNDLFARINKNGVLKIQTK